MEADKKIIATAGIVTVAVGSINSIGNHKQLPSTKFLLGSGAVYLILSVLADAGQEEIAKALAIAVMTTVILGEGNGALSWINSKGEINTQKPNHTGSGKRPNNAGSSIGANAGDVFNLRTHDGSDAVPGFPGIPATR